MVLLYIREKNKAITSKCTEEFKLGHPLKTRYFVGIEVDGVGETAVVVDDEIVVFGFDQDEEGVRTFVELEIDFVEKSKLWMCRVNGNVP